MDDPSWELVQSFVRVAQAGSLTKAARGAGMSQPTLSRHIAELEERLGVRLFDRVPQGLKLTPQGAALSERARGVGAQMDAFLRAASGMAEQVSGVVRVSLSESMSAGPLATWIGSFCAEHPQIELEWVVSNQGSDLLGREADVAVRMYKPEQLDLVARRVGEIALGLYASRDYVARHGEPSVEELRAHRWVGFDRDEQFIRDARALGYHYSREDFVFRSDSLLAQQAAIQGGVGVGVMPRYSAAQLPELVEVMRHIPMRPLPVWVVAHQEVHTSARVRLVFDALAEHLEAYVVGESTQRR
jgi:DNA-binding transcriptional LysR family regulator